MIGAGVIGVTTAWYLRQQGVNVAVVEQRAGVAQEASFGNAGVIAPGYVTPWAAPGMPRKVLSYLFAAEAPVLFRPSLNPALWRWVLRWLGECRLERYRENKSRMQRVAFYSRDQLHRLRDQLSIQYEQSQGYLQLLRAQRENAASEQGSKMTAMDNATRNAGDMINKLTIQYNRTRQAAITTELVEIISGAEAL